MIKNRVILHEIRNPSETKSKAEVLPTESTWTHTAGHTELSSAACSTVLTGTDSHGTSSLSQRTLKVRVARELTSHSWL